MKMLSMVEEMRHPRFQDTLALRALLGSLCLKDVSHPLVQGGMQKFVRISEQTQLWYVPRLVESVTLTVPEQAEVLAANWRRCRNYFCRTFLATFACWCR
jgi:hypothetical protein